MQASWIVARSFKKWLIKSNSMPQWTYEKTYLQIKHSKCCQKACKNITFTQNGVVIFKMDQCGKLAAMKELINSIWRKNEKIDDNFNEIRNNCQRPNFVN